MNFLHILVAERAGEMVGFLRFLLQEIGPDTDCPPLQLQGNHLIEAKVMAFAVLPACRGQGHWTGPAAGGDRRGDSAGMSPIALVQ